MAKQIVAAAQLGPASPTRAETVARIVQLIERAGKAGVELAVFPELSFSPYFCTVVHDDVTPFVEAGFPSAETAPILTAAGKHHVAVVIGFAERVGSSLFNSAAIIDATGREVGRFRKVHIPGRAEPAPDSNFNILEKRYFKSGDLGFPVYDSPVGHVGMLICYDRRFPEAYRCLGLGGADVIAIGYNTPFIPGSPFTPALGDAQGQSELCMRAGAYANGVYVIGTGKAGVENGVQYIGGSLIVDPTGRMLAKAKTDGDELVLAEIDQEVATEVRRRLNLDVNRMPGKYDALVRTRVPA